MTTMSPKEFAEYLRGLTGELEQAAIRGMREAAAEGVGLVVAEIDAADAVDTSGLRQSVRTEELPKGAILGTFAPHAPFVEYGTRPHWPPLGPLQLWAVRKLGVDPDEAEEVAEGIARSIAWAGTRPRRFFAKAMKRVRKLARKRVLEHVSRVK